MAKLNCWEMKKCGREPGGSKVGQMGVCPAATMGDADGYCGGKNGGRGCMYITGTFCGGNIQGTHKEKEKNCAECEFYKTVRHEEGANLSVLAFNKYVKERKG